MPNGELSQLDKNCGEMVQVEHFGVKLSQAGILGMI
jgi:hypothetical protein